jgi:hypothetical protein
LKIFNVLGQEVTTLVDEVQQSGDHSAVFDAATFSSGVYFYKLAAGSFTKTGKILLVK